MKKYILVFAIAVLAGSSAFAYHAPDPGYRVLEQFRKEFPTAEEANWGTEAGYAKVSFVLSGRRVIAFFNVEGELEGSIRNIFYDQLPLAVMSSLEKRFTGAEVLYIREINNAEGTHYRIRLDANEKKYLIRISSNGNISEVDKVK